MIPKSVRKVEHDGLGGFERRAFTILATGQAFRTLIDGLYSNKIGAVVRELWTNAVDSHVEAGQTEPFQVDVPTLLDPTFRVRDFGVSLSHDDVLGLYSTLFDSRKRESNEQTGKWGLGSKSPFAYGDTFVVQAYLDGLKRTYVANIMDDDMPEIRHLSTELTDEPQGFEVSIPVATDDFRKFEREVERMVLATDVDKRPTVSGLSRVIPEPVLSGDGWRIFDRTYDMGNFAVRQGCVMYSVNTVYPQIDSGYLMVVDVPIGSCEITASRESLSMDDDTTLAVNTAHDSAWAGVQAFINSLTYENRLDEFQKRDRYSFIYGVTRRNHLNLNPDKPNKGLPGQALLTYNPNKVTKPAWNSTFSDPGVLHLIVDDVTPRQSDGYKMLRRQLRIKEYTKSLDYNSRVAVVSREELPRIVRVLGIAPDRVMALSTLPDVAVTRNYSGNGGVRGGVTGTAAPKQLPAGSYWVRKYGAMSLGLGGSRWNPALGDLDTQGSADTFWLQRQGLLTTLGFKEDQIVFLTEAQSDRFDPTGSRRLTTAVEKRAIKYADKHNFSTRFVGSRNSQVFNDRFSIGWSNWSNPFKFIDGKAHELIRNRVMVDLGLGNPYDTPNRWDNEIADIAKISFSATLTAAEIQSKVDEYKKVYPLLFTDGGSSLIDFYIQTTDEQENNK